MTDNTRVPRLSALVTPVGDSSLNAHLSSGDVIVRDPYSNDQEQERTGLLSGSLVGRDETGTVVGRQKGSSWYASVFLVVNAALGAGLLNFPAAYHHCGGLAVAISIQACLMIFVIISLLTLTYCSDINQSATYQDVVYSLCGKWTQLMCSLCVAVYSFGTCITFLIIIADQWGKFFKALSLEDHWYTSRAFTLVVSTVPIILPMCYAKRIDFLKYASSFGVVAVIYCVILVFVKYFTEPDHNRGPMAHSPEHWSDVFVVVPVICFGYQCHVSVVPIYSCLEKRTVREFSKTLGISMALCIFTYTVVASFGYMTFGSHVNEDILLSYESTPDVLIAEILIGAKMYVTYPILLFVGRAAFDNVWAARRCLSPEQVATGERTRRIVTTTVWFAVSLALAVFVPNIGVVINMLGGLAAVFIFTFPGLCLLQVVLQGYVDKVQHKHFYRFLYGLAVFCLIFGAFLFGETTTQSIYTDLKKKNV